MNIKLLHFLVWNFLPSLKVSHINPQVVIKKYVLSAIIILINPKHFSNLSNFLFSNSWPNIVLNHSWWILKPVHHLDILLDSIFNNLNFFVFNQWSKMIMKLFVWFYLDSVKWISNKCKFLAKSKVHSLVLNF